VLSSAQSFAEEQSRSVYVSGFLVEPQLAPGRFSAQLVWQLDANDDTAQLPAIPPTRTIVPQQTVPVPHSFAPVLPMQSIALVDDEQVASQLSVNVVES
jgi:hypothetical protein